MRKVLDLMMMVFIGISCHNRISVETTNSDTSTTAPSSRSVNGFNEIEVSGAIDLHVQQGNQEAVSISASTPELAAKIKTKVVGGLLKIYIDDNGFNWGNNAVMKADVTYTHLNKIEAAGACTVQGKNINTSTLNLNLSGASTFEGSVLVDNLEIDMSGACKLKISGSANQTKIGASGACNMKGYRLKTNFCKVDASGASNIYVTVAKEITGEASGGSNVYYKGDGVAKDIDASGGSSFSKSNEEEE